MHREYVEIIAREEGLAAGGSICGYSGLRGNISKKVEDLLWGNGMSTIRAEAELSVRGRGNNVIGDGNGFQATVSGITG